MTNNDSDRQNLTLYRQTATAGDLPEIVGAWLKAARKAAGGKPVFHLLTEGFPANRFISIGSAGGRPAELEQFLRAPGDCTVFHLFCQENYLRGRRRLDGDKRDNFNLLATRPGPEPSIFARLAALFTPGGGKTGSPAWDETVIPYAGEEHPRRYILWGRWDEDTGCFFENQIPRRLFYPTETTPAQGARAVLKSREYFAAGRRPVFYAFTGLETEPEEKSTRGI